MAKRKIVVEAEIIRKEKVSRDYIKNCINSAESYFWQVQHAIKSGDNITKTAPCCGYMNKEEINALDKFSKAIFNKYSSITNPYMTAQKCFIIMLGIGECTICKGKSKLLAE